MAGIRYKVSGYLPCSIPKIKRKKAYKPEVHQSPPTTNNTFIYGYLPFFHSLKICTLRRGLSPSSDHHHVTTHQKDQNSSSLSIKSGCGMLIDAFAPANRTIRVQARAYWPRNNTAGACLSVCLFLSEGRDYKWRGNILYPSFLGLFSALFWAFGFINRRVVHISHRLPAGMEKWDYIRQLWNDTIFCSILGCYFLVWTKILPVFDWIAWYYEESNEPFVCLSLPAFVYGRCRISCILLLVSLLYPI